MKWYRLAAKQGHVKSLTNIGLLFESGLGVGQDNAAAVKWYRRGTQHGDPNAQRHLGVMYINGTGLEQNQRAGSELIATAAAQNDSEAMRILGVLYQRGIGVEENSSKAVEWFRKAQANGIILKADALTLIGQVEAQQKTAALAIGIWDEMGQNCNNSFAVLGSDGSFKRYSRIGTTRWQSSVVYKSGTYIVTAGTLRIVEQGQKRGVKRVLEANLDLSNTQWMVLSSPSCKSCTGADLTVTVSGKSVDPPTAHAWQRCDLGMLDNTLTAQTSSNDLDRVVAHADNFARKHPRASSFRNVLLELLRALSIDTFGIFHVDEMPTYAFPIIKFVDGYSIRIASTRLNSLSLSPATIYFSFPDDDRIHIKVELPTEIRQLSSSQDTDLGSRITIKAPAFSGEWSRKLSSFTQAQIDSGLIEIFEDTQSIALIGGVLVKLTGSPVKGRGVNNAWSVTLSDVRLHDEFMADQLNVEFMMRNFDIAALDTLWGEDIDVEDYINVEEQLESAVQRGELAKLLRSVNQLSKQVRFSISIHGLNTPTNAQLSGPAAGAQIRRARFGFEIGAAQGERLDRLVLSVSLAKLDVPKNNTSEAFSLLAPRELRLSIGLEDIPGDGIFDILAETLALNLPSTESYLGLAASRVAYLLMDTGTMLSLRDLVIETPAVGVSGSALIKIDPRQPYLLKGEADFFLRNLQRAAQLIAKQDHPDIAVMLGLLIAFGEPVANAKDTYHYKITITADGEYFLNGRNVAPLLRAIQSL